MSKEDHPSQQPRPSLGWWVISGEALLEGLRAVAGGEDPDLVYAELYANSDQEDYRE